MADPRPSQSKSLQEIQEALRFRPSEGRDLREIQEAIAPTPVGIKPGKMPGEEFFGPALERGPRGEPSAAMSLTHKELVKERAKITGVDIGGAPFGVRSVMSLPPYVDERVARDGLAHYYGEPIAVRTDPETKEIEYFDQNTERWTLLHSIDFDVGDLGALRGPAKTLPYEMLGAVGGNIAVPGWGLVPGAVVGITIGEHARYKEAQQHGMFQGEDDVDLWNRAFMNAGLPTAVGGYLATWGINASRFLMGASTLRAMKAPIGAEQLERQLEEVKRLRAEVEARLPEGEQFPVTVGQTGLTPGAPAARELFELERQIASTPAGEPIVKVYDQQYRAAKAYFDEMRVRHGIPEAESAHAFDLGDTYQKTAHKRLDLVDKKLTERTGKAGAEFQEAAEREILREAEPARTPLIGEAMRGVRRRENFEYQKLATASYDEIEDVRRTMGYLDPIPTTHSVRAGRRAKSLLNTNVIKSLREAHGSSIDDFLEAASKTDELSWEQVHGTLRALRAERRAIRRGETRGIDEATIDMMEKGLIKDRAAYLRDKPVLATKVDEVESFVAREKDRLDRGLIARLTSRRAGRDVYRDEQFFDQIIKPYNQSGARNVADILKNPRGALSPADQEMYAAAWEGTRRGIREKYKEEVLDKPTKGMLKAHNNFMKRYGETIEPFFAKDEMRRIQKLGGMVRVMEEEAARYDRLMAVAAEHIDPLKLRNLRRPMDVFREVWVNGDAATVERFWRSIRKDPELQRQFKGVAHNHLQNFLDTGALEGITYDFRQLGKYLNRWGRQTETLFGREYRHDLKVFHNMLSTMMREPPDVFKTAGYAPWFRHIARMMVGMFTVKGRILTAGIRFRQKSAERALGKVLADPGEFRRLMRLKSLPYNSAEAAQVMAGAGMWAWLSEIRPALEEPSLPRGAKEPQ
jgi:hypothetical protein